MSGFLLDTNVPSELIRPQPEPKVKTWVAAQSLDTLFISAVSFGEFRKSCFSYNLEPTDSGGL
jgi:predicted nucleic acid-binding protein